MYSFKNDYSEGAHPRILDALVRSNLEQSDGYGEDTYTEKACELIKRHIGRDDVFIHLFTGGTQTNLTSISSFLRPHEAVVAANTGHILVHETGAIEATGHKVISISVDDGKISPEDIEKVIEAHEDEHMVKPKLVYISNPTEIGSIYNKEELQNLSRFCKENNLYLYVDGARLASALTSYANDLTLNDLANLTDVFYIGGTKNGTLIGEALVISNQQLEEDFRYMMKQKGALLAKGRVLGIQFLELFKDNLFFEMGKHANDMAGLIKNALIELGYDFVTDSPSNQLFPIMPDSVIDALREKYQFYKWSKEKDGYSSIRLVTSWATSETVIHEFIADIKKASKN